MAASEHVLVGDIGGTNARFALGHVESGRIVIDHFEKLKGDDFPDFEDALAVYLDRVKTDAKPHRALFAFAGPVENNRATLTNREGWDVNGNELAGQMGLTEVRVVNDYAAMARAMAELPDSAFHTIHKGRPRRSAPILVAGPGTGVGMATLLPLPGGRWYVLTGEGGHGSYAPGNELECALVNELRRRHGHVSRELVLSGSGMEKVMEALSAIRNEPYIKRTPEEVLELANQGDPLCRAVCEMRAAGVMQMVGDAVLTNGARGGVVITGGVAERLVSWLETPTAQSRFFSRGPMSHYMQDVPIRLIKEPRAALYGAAALLFE